MGPFLSGLPGIYWLLAAVFYQFKTWLRGVAPRQAEQDKTTCFLLDAFYHCCCSPLRWEGGHWGSRWTELLRDRSTFSSPHQGASLVSNKFPQSWSGTVRYCSPLSPSLPPYHPQIFFVNEQGHTMYLNPCRAYSILGVVYSYEYVNCRERDHVLLFGHKLSHWRVRNEDRFEQSTPFARNFDHDCLQHNNQQTWLLLVS